MSLNRVEGLVLELVALFATFCYEFHSVAPCEMVGNLLIMK